MAFLTNIHTKYFYIMFWSKVEKYMINQNQFGIRRLYFANSNVDFFTLDNNNLISLRIRIFKNNCLKNMYMIESYFYLKNNI